MDAERWKRVEDLLQSALELPADQQEEFLRQACGADTTLLQEVQSLLTSHRKVGSFLEPPATDGAAQTAAFIGVETKGPSITGQTISHYRVLGPLANGGMGVVYRAEDIKLGRGVALKFLPSELARYPVAFDRLQREARAASGLDHPNICPIYELGEYDGQPFIAMQLLEGETLGEWIESAHNLDMRLRLRRALDLAVQVANGLEAAHQKGIIHRDMKPANIFITRRGDAKILDFGLAKQLVEDDPAPTTLSDTTGADIPAANADPTKQHLTRTGTMMGTVSYMSPEQIRGEKLDARTDLFSLGLVLYEMVTGQRAFTGETGAAVHDAILLQEPTPVRQLNPAISSELERIIDKALEKDRNRRYRSADELARDLESLREQFRAAVAGGRSRLKLATATVALVAVATVGGLYYHGRRAKFLTDKDTIVLADFTNTTGDAMFDDTLKQGLSVQLEQSPFLELISDQKVNDTLKLMGRSAGDRLTPEITREICQRTGSKAMLTGSIAPLGREYVVGIKAVNCDTGDVLAEAQRQAAGNEEVLRALDGAAVKLRGQLGESLSTVQKYSTPLIEATTPSLEALKSYSLGWKIWSTQGATPAMPLFQRAVELDPSFALAYAGIVTAQSNLNQPGLAAEAAREAYALRAKVSERERFEIDISYHQSVTGNLEKMAQVIEEWRQTYPRDKKPFIYLPFISSSLGNREQGLEYGREVFRYEPDRADTYANLGDAYTSLNRLDEAEAVYKQAQQRNLENEDLLINRYILYFLRADKTQMAQVAAASMGKPGLEDILLAQQADTEGWYGKLERSRELTRDSIASAEDNQAKETAGLYQVVAALREVASGNLERARAGATAAMKSTRSRDVQNMGALVLALAGDTGPAEKRAAELDKRFPEDTLVQKYWLPSIRAAIAMQRGHPNQAVEQLKLTTPIELGQPVGFTVYLCPIYLRGEAYLMLHDGNRARAEFQKFIEHRGLVGNFFWGALARLGLARAFAMEGDEARARAAYQDFLTLWKDGDPETPVLRRAKEEYARLPRSNPELSDAVETNPRRQ